MWSPDFRIAIQWVGAAALAVTLAGCSHSSNAPDLDAPAGAGVLALGASSVAANESDGRVSLLVLRSGGSKGTVAVTLSTADGTATAGRDYSATSITVTFGDGEMTAKQVDVPLLEDADQEATETFTVSLAGPTGGAGLGVTTATVSIVDDDSPHGGGLDDTGVTTCATQSAEHLICGSKAAGTDGLPRQDGELGRDPTVGDDSDGHSGFSFVKLDPAGRPLADQRATYDKSPWACVTDRTTGLMWEVRTTDGGLRDRRWRYSWYAAAGLRPSFAHGAENGGTCVDTTSCDTQKYLEAVNAARLCGHADWRLPTRSELLSLVDYGAGAGPLIDPAFFPDGAADDWWTSNRDFTGLAWVVSFDGGMSRTITPGEALPVRLMRRGAQ